MNNTRLMKSYKTGSHISSLVLLISLLIIYSCEDKRNQYFYQDYPDSIDKSIWEVISDSTGAEKYPQFSRFVEYCKEYRFDTILNNGLTHTLFIPVNEAFDGFDTDSFIMNDVLSYHLSETMFLLRNINQKRKLQTYLKKFSVIEEHNYISTYNGIEIVLRGPICKNGTFYGIEKIAYPIPNLYEYISSTSQVLKEYIDSQDTLYFTPALSTPVGFDPSTGSTIYDSVFQHFNAFEENYFNLKDEYRTKSATMVLFDQEQYDSALTAVALNLATEGYDSNEDIPKKWQDEYLLPNLMKQGVFDGSLYYEDFIPTELQNIAGDSVIVKPETIDPQSRITCSNGVVFNYKSLDIPESLYSTYHIEGEWMVDSIGANLWVWNTDKYCIETEGEVFTPSESSTDGASGDSLVLVEFPFNYDQTYSFSFCMQNVFPGRYLLKWEASYRPSGNFEIYINDGEEPVRQFDLFDLRKTVFSVLDNSIRYTPNNSLNTLDAEVIIKEFGDVKITLKYINPGFSKINGFSIDYISLTRTK
jgi:hypothetical protein